jgi:hypothetical protein
MSPGKPVNIGGVDKKSDRSAFEAEIFDFSSHQAIENGRKIILEIIIKNNLIVFILLIPKSL